MSSRTKAAIVSSKTDGRFVPHSRHLVMAGLPPLQTNPRNSIMIFNWRVLANPDVHRDNANAQQRNPTQAKRLAGKTGLRREQRDLAGVITGISVCRSVKEPF